MPDTVLDPGDNATGRIEAALYALAYVALTGDFIVPLRNPLSEAVALAAQVGQFGFVCPITPAAGMSIWTVPKTAFGPAGFIHHGRYGVENAARSTLQFGQSCRSHLIAF